MISSNDYAVPQRIKDGTTGTIEYQCGRCGQWSDGVWATFVMGFYLCTACFDAEYGPDEDYEEQPS
ncbi:MAG: hypothetical protein KGL39_35215 [Patescibacteria group bacterium]|nr:hypothetical protein [Patescibacteria group bacterium]